MRILINALFLIPNRVGGSETYLRGLVAGLSRIDGENEYLLALGPEAAPTFRPPSEKWNLVVSPTPSTRRAQRMLVEQTWLPYMASKLGAEIVHSAGYTAPLISGPPGVVSILDMNYKRHPEDLSLAERAVYAALIPPVAKRSRHVITLSEASRDDILRWINVPVSRVTPTPLAPRTDWPGDPEDDGARLRAAGISGRYVLSVAASYPHKNLRRLLEAFPLDGGKHEPVQLVLVGLKGRAHQVVKTIANGRSGVIRDLGWVDEATLASLYRNAAALAFPSLYEGFGLPILEAMALGTPVLTSDVGAMAEVAGGAAELVDPRHVGDIRRGLMRLSADPSRREELRMLGRLRANQFSWEKTASITLQVYQASAS